MVLEKTILKLKKEYIEFMEISDLPEFKIAHKDVSLEKADAQSFAVSAAALFDVDRSGNKA